MVNGIASSPAASSVASRRSGVLSGAPRWAARSGRSDSTIIPWDGATVAQPGQVVAGDGAGVHVGQQPRLLEDPPAHRHQVVDRRGVAVADSQSRASA